MNELDQLRDDIGDLRESNGRHDANIQTLTTQLATLTAAVTDLTGVLNRGRGALWAICAACGAAGAAVSSAIHFFATVGKT
jgi:hypothetical protein